MSEKKIFAGLDIGSRTAKGVVLSPDGELLSVFGAGDGAAQAAFALEKELSALGFRVGEAAVAVTGVGRGAFPLPALKLTDGSAAALALAHLYPGVRVALEVGAEEIRAVLTDGAGRALDILVNDKCASGSGAFMEAMARALSMTIGEFGAAGLGGSGELRLNSRCAVFAESEVVGLIHQNIPREDIAWAIHDMIAQKASGLLKKLGDFGEAAFFGGAAQSPAMREAVFRHLGGARLIVPDEPASTGALGAALAALRKAQKGS